MRALIFTEGGSEFGLGHVSRCSSIYDEIQSRGINTEIIIYGNNINLAIPKNKNYKMLNWMSEEFLNRYVTKEDYCVVDSYLANEKIYQILSDRAKGCLFIDDNSRLEYPYGFVVNPSLNTSGLLYANDYKKRYLLGHKYIILRSPFLNAKREKVNEYVHNILITMGGTNQSNMILSVVNKLMRKYPNLKFDVIAKKEFVNINKIINYNSSNVRVHQTISAEKMKEIMLNADIAISAAGQTIYELLATKTPFIPIKVAENQTNNIEGLKKFKLVERILDIKDPFMLERLDTEFTKMKHLSVRQSLIKKYENIIDGLGVKRIVDSLIKGGM